MTNIGYITTKNILADDDATPHPRLTAATVKKARKEIVAVQKALDRILAHATKGAKDLLGGDHWSENIDLFESMSMEQARVLARFPVRTNHPKFGKTMLGARKTFVEFRESVRWEIIGRIYTDTTRQDYEKAVKLITGRARKASDNLKMVELVLA